MLSILLSFLLGRSGTVDHAVKGLVRASNNLEQVRDKFRARAERHRELAYKAKVDADTAHAEADRAHRVAGAIKTLIS